MNCRWIIAPPQPLLVEPLVQSCGVSPLLAQCLLNRGFSRPEEVSPFLEPRLAQLADPFLLPDMELAVQRLYRAHLKSEPVVIFGDYDVDGVTATALLTEVMRTLGWKVNHYLPHRMDEGYGLTREGVENCLTRHPSTLLLAVDCGSTAVETIDWLREQGTEVIVVDHHQLSATPPAAVALVNPHHRRSSDAVAASATAYCSAGLAFKLAHALVKRGRQLEHKAAHKLDLRPLLDLVALGTVADLVPLTGENRTFVTAGLRVLDQTQRPGLRALMEVAKVKSPVGVYEIGFQLAPRLNAAGRLENAQQALDLLLAPDEAAARPLAEELDARNRERQNIERNMAEQVIGAIRAKFNPETDFAIVEGQLLWHVGVVGIVASRVVREFYRPTLILGGDGEAWRGSGRSIEGFNLADGLAQCSDLLVRHGGHAMAAGVTVHPNNLEALRQRLNDLVRRQLAPEQLRPVLRIDAEVSASELTLETVTELGRLEPFGQGNPSVQLVLRGLTLQQAPQRMGANQQHARLRVTDGQSACAEVVCWNMEPAALPQGRFDLACVPQLNEFNGRTTVQLKLLDWQPSAAN